MRELIERVEKTSQLFAGWINKPVTPVTGQTGHGDELTWLEHLRRQRGYGSVWTDELFVTLHSRL